MTQEITGLAAVIFDGSDGGTGYVFERYTKNADSDKPWYDYSLKVSTTHYGIGSDMRIPLPSKEVVTGLIESLTKVLSEMNSKYSKPSYIRNLGEYTLDNNVKVKTKDDLTRELINNILSMDGNSGAKEFIKEYFDELKAIK